MYVAPLQNTQPYNVLFLRSPALCGAVSAIVNASGIIKEDKP